MDELPQLWNIFGGDMSFVGPRALRPGGDRGRRRRQRPVPLDDDPGLRGCGTACARASPASRRSTRARDIPRRQKFRLDRLYVGRQSFWLDLRLIALSFWITFRGAMGAPRHESSEGGSAGGAGQDVRLGSAGEHGL